MTTRPDYGLTAKLLHWLVVVLLVIQYAIGWLMPDVHRGPPGVPMMFHISFGISILAVIVLRFAWRLTHPVEPASTLPPWQRIGAEAAHWLLYALVFATTMTGWLFLSMRGWSVSLFGVLPLPLLTAPSAPVARAIGEWHETVELVLVIMIGLHVAAALAHLVVYRDRVMQRMLLR
jgi:cytochrome b561